MCRLLTLPLCTLSKLTIYFELLDFFHDNHIIKLFGGSFLNPLDTLFLFIVPKLFNILQTLSRFLIKKSIDLSNVYIFLYIYLYMYTSAVCQIDLKLNLYELFLFSYELTSSHLICNLQK